MNVVIILRHFFIILIIIINLLLLLFIMLLIEMLLDPLCDRYMQLMFDILFMGSLMLGPCVLF